MWLQKCGQATCQRSIREKSLINLGDRSGGPARITCGHTWPCSYCSPSSPWNVMRPRVCCLRLDMFQPCWRECRLPLFLAPQEPASVSTLSRPRSHSGHWFIFSKVTANNLRTYVHTWFACMWAHMSGHCTCSGWCPESSSRGLSRAPGLASLS